MDMAKLPAVLTLPHLQDVTVQTVKYSGQASNALSMDIYYPPGPSASRAPQPVVILVTGHVDAAIEATLGCKLKDTEQYRSWARLLAVSGMVAITYENQIPVDDIVAVVNHVQNNADALGVDLQRLGVWSCSANVPNALALMISRQASISCAGFLYGFMLDPVGKTFVADAAAHSGFAAPNGDKSIADVPAETAMHIVRAGADQVPGINATIDDFCARALQRNLPLTLVNHAQAPHAFDLLDNTDLTRMVIQDMLNFFTFHLQVET